jgi:hypothetical protein
LKICILDGFFLYTELIFEDGNVEGRVDRNVVREKGIEVLSERTSGDMEAALKRAVDY